MVLYASGRAAMLAFEIVENWVGKSCGSSKACFILAELSASAAAADAEASPIAMEEDAAIPDITTASVADASSSPDPNEGDDSSIKTTASVAGARFTTAVVATASTLLPSSR